MKRLIHIALILSILWAIFSPKVKSTSSGVWKVYGSMGCGWTKKQIAHLKSKGISHTFVDCTKQSCHGVDGFPTLVHSQSGEKIVGYTEKI